MVKPRQFIDGTSNVIAVLRLGEVEKVDGTSASAQSTATTEDVVVRVAAETACHVEYGTNPTATATASSYWPANHVEYIWMASGTKLAAVGGIINITIMQ